MMDSGCMDLAKVLQESIGDRMLVRPLRTGGCLVRLPFLDEVGDPIELGVRQTETGFIIDDAGAVAGRMFMLDHYIEETAAVNLLNSLAKSYGLILDQDDGALWCEADRDNLFDRIMELAKVLLAMLTVLPHLPVRQYRGRTLGQRVRKKIKEQFEERHILHYIDSEYPLAGMVWPTWSVDYRWKYGNPDHPGDVYVVAVDLDVIGAKAKAEEVNTLALDTAQTRDAGRLRVVMDRHGRNSQASLAADLLRAYSQQLGFTVFDFEQPRERDLFINQTIEEIASPMGQAWKALLASGQPSKR